MVGDIIKHLGPPSLWLSRVYKIGIVNAAVLPDPVGAIAIKLLPAKIIGIAAI